MLILAIDTTAKIASAALVRDGGTIGETTLSAGNTHSETILPSVEFLLSATGYTLADVDVFACTVGPGSFTGVRIGTATVKGLAFSRGECCVAVSTLDAIAENFAGGECDGGAGDLICPVMDARRDQVYTAVFELRDGALLRLTEDMAISIDELDGILSGMMSGGAHGYVRFAGDGYGIVYPKLSARLERVRATPIMMREHSAASAARAACRLLSGGAKMVDAAELAPTYLRLSQAEREYAERHGGEQAFVLGTL